MIPPVSHCSLAASAIDLGNLSFFLAPEAAPPGPQLISSIREYGILHPPLVQQHEERYLVITGRKRLEVAINILRWETVPCISVPSSCPTLSLYALLLEQSLLGTPLSPAEQSAFLAGLRKSCSVEETLPFLAKLGYKPTPHQLAELIKLRGLSDSAFLALHRGTLSLAGARKMLHLARADQDTLTELISRFQLGGSKQQRLIELGSDLQRRQERSMAEIIAPFLEKMEASRQENIPQQAAALLSWLHTQCFPRSTQAEQEFNRRSTELDLPPGMQIVHSPSFEDDTLTITLKFADWSTLQEALPALRKNLGRG